MRIPPGDRRFTSPDPDIQGQVRDELEFHLEMRTRELIEQGLDPEHARREAQRLLGDRRLIEQACADAAQRGFRPRRPVRALTDFLQDVTYAIRTLRKAPGYALVTILTLGLAIGANTAVFTLVDGVLLSPLPYGQPDRLMTIWSTVEQSSTRSPVSYTDYRDWKAQATSFEHMTMLYGYSMTLHDVEGPVEVISAAVSNEFFDALRARALLGVPFGPGQEDGGQPLVLKYGTWQSRFGGDPAIIGRTLTFDSGTYTVVAVMDKEVGFPGWAQFWIPLTQEIVNAQGLDTRDQRVDTWVLGRLRPGVPVAAAQSEMQAIAQRLEDAYPETNRDWGAWVVPLRQIVLDPWGRNQTLLRALWFLNGAVALVLLIACVNVANLSLARVVERRHEIAVRLALGAGAGRIVRQMLTESLMLSAVGAGLGLLLARWAVSLALAHGPALPRQPEVGLDMRVLAFTVGLVVLTAVLFGLVPALRGARGTFEGLYGTARRVAGSRSGRRWQTALVTSQLALALLLLVGAGLLTVSLRNLTNVDPGFDISNLHILRPPLPSPPYDTDEQLVAMHRRMERAAEALPGVVGAATVNHVPGGGLVLTNVLVEGVENDLRVAFRTVSPDYLQTMDIHLLQGRYLQESDMAPWTGAMVINKRLSTQLGLSVGDRLTVFKSRPGRDFGEPVSGFVAGITGDVRGALNQSLSEYTVYVPETVNPWQSATLVVRVAPGGRDVGAMLRQMLQELDPTLAPGGQRTMEQQMEGSLAQQRFASLLMVAFAVAALLLAAVGVYGVLAYYVRNGSAEIGVRMALGARSADVVRHIVGRAMIMVLAGVVVGLGAAIWLTRLLGSLLVGVRPTDPLTIAVVTGALIAVALLATYIPARRAARLDPMAVLRTE